MEIDETAKAEVREREGEGMIPPKKMKTADYEIVQVIPPCDDGIHSKYWQFLLRGPGWDANFYYVANSESCGPCLIKSLQAAFDAGLLRGMYARMNARMKTLVTKDLRGK